MAAKSTAVVVDDDRVIQWKKLRSGDWGIRVAGGDHASLKGGDKVDVTSGRTGKTKTVEISNRVTTNSDSTLYGIVDERRLIPQGSTPAAEFEYRDGDGNVSGEVNVYVVGGVTMLQLVPVREGKAGRDAVLVLAGDVQELIEDLATVPKPKPSKPAAEAKSTRSRR